jgi:2,3-bisphosphoglycerate-independent phosphoglycerate mutase
MKILLAILDGLGDTPISELGDKTPLEAAHTPNMDKLAEEGMCGLVVPYIFPGEDNPTSEGAHVALFGYKDYFLGRGPYEAAGAGIDMKEGEVAFRVNFGTVDDDLMITDRRAGRINKTELLSEAVSGKEIDGVEFLVKSSFGHRGVLVMRPNKGIKLSAKVSDGDPHKVGVKVNKINNLEESKEAKFTADVLNKFLGWAHDVLENHPFNQERRESELPPGNYLLIRGAGEMSEVPSFKDKYGLNSAFVAGGTLYKGVAKIIGMEEINVAGATGLADTDLEGKIQGAKKALKDHDFVFLHIKATDTFSHDGDFENKKLFIEEIDKHVKTLLGLENTLIIITGDHSTCCKLKDHCKEPIPFLLNGAEKDEVDSFCEKECKKGGLGKFNQDDLMKKVLDINKNKKID